jgi:hypothetical protein
MPDRYRYENDVKPEDVNAGDYVFITGPNDLQVEGYVTYPIMRTGGWFDLGSEPGRSNVTVMVKLPAITSITRRTERKLPTTPGFYIQESHTNSTLYPIWTLTTYGDWLARSAIDGDNQMPTREVPDDLILIHAVR